MSNIYIQEPPASGKVLIKTTVGDIDIELWTREAPKACRNFIQLCMENYYDGTIFHRVVKDFIVQGGDPTGTGDGGDSIYGHPFKDEFHTRLRFCRRGLVAMANAGKDDNGSQFFFTLASTPELQNKHTIFGKVAGDTVYNMLKLGEALVDENEKPIYPQKIVKTQVLNNPFSDIVPRKADNSGKDMKERKKDKAAAVKNFKLLSFGEEAEEDEEETTVINKTFSGKGKSAHDTLSDPKLSSQSAIEIEAANAVEETKTEEELAAIELEKRETADRIKNKLLGKKSQNAEEKEKNVDEEEEEPAYILGQHRREERHKKAEEIRKEIRDLKRGVRDEKQKKEDEVKKKEEEKVQTEKKEGYLKDYLETQKLFKEVTSKVPKKGKSREALTQELLKKFKNKLSSAREQSNEAEKSNPDEEEDDDTWMTHKLHCEEKNSTLAKDANSKGDDWFEIYDPRNPLNKRRRGETSDSSKKKKK